MENKKLLKFLYKDIAEIEELFVDKGSEGFDEYEIEFIQSRFKGAKQVIQILSEKENKQLKRTRSRRVVSNTDEVEVLSVGEADSAQSYFLEEEGEGNLLNEPQSIEEEENVQALSQVEVEEAKRLEALSQFEEEIKESDQSQVTEKKVEESIQSQLVEKEVEGLTSQDIENPEVDLKQKESDVEMDDEEEEVGNANHRLGDSFLKEKSVNELLASDDSSKLEYRISNSPVASIKAAIGINDRYQYIRELFEGNGDTFTKAVSDLDNLDSIEEAVSYLQQNYKWKKNETSLKFVNLVKRRFPNG